MTTTYNQFTIIKFNINEISGTSVEANAKEAVSLNDTAAHKYVDLGYNVANTTYIINYSLLIETVPTTDGTKIELVIVEKKGDDASETVVKPAYTNDKKVWFNGIHKINLTEETPALKIQFMYKYLEAINADYSFQPDENVSHITFICSRTYDQDHYVKMQLPTASE
ncbi:hypothetical protein ECIV_ORF87 [European chub iridovirus]|nr:hypothetical protein ECIV_ORF87 [European chub iridovirus]